MQKISEIKEEYEKLGSLAVGIVALLFAGVIYAWSVLAAPIAAEFPSWSGSALSLTFTICMSSFCLGAFFAGLLSRRIPARFNVLISAVLFFAGFLISSRLQTLISLYLGYGVLCGMASGFTYNAVISTIPGLFPKNSALVSGILLMAFGTSSLVMGMLFTTFTPPVTGAWRQSFLFLSFFMAAVFVVAFLLFPTVRPAAGQLDKALAEPTGSNDCTTLGMLKKRDFYSFFFWLVFISAAGLALISQARSIALFVSPDTGAPVLSLIVGVIAVCNGLGRIIFGRLFDKAGNKRTMMIINALLLFAGLVLLIAIQSGVFVILIAGFVLLGVDYGGSPLVCAAFTRSAYGNKHFAANYSIANMNLLVASFSGAISGMLFDASQSYMTTMLLLIVLGMAAMVLLVILNLYKDICQIAKSVL